MYHPEGTWIVRLALSAFTAVSLSATSNMPSNAEPPRLTSTVTSTGSTESSTLTNPGLSYVQAPSRKKSLKKSPTEVAIYAYDDAPLGDRSPLLMVHGLRGEFWPNFRWGKVAEHFKKDQTFNKTYKIYFCRYPTLVRLENTIPKFQKEIDRLYSASNERPITLVALSMGGNLCYESMQDPDTESKIKALMALGSPFHGSPLFSGDWMQYSLYKRISMPWTRVDHSLALKLYFNRNQNLLADLAWDDVDNAIPDGGKFKSRLLFGPKGEVAPKKTANFRLQKLNETNLHIKRKLITYGGYIHNPYLEPTAERYLENAAMYPITFLTVKFPAHVGREHPVLKMLNRDIASVEVNKSWKENNKPAFLYALNDGITPLSSALFLPGDALKAVPLISQDAVRKLRDKTDVKLARAFKNVDHLTYIDGDRPVAKIKKLEGKDINFADELRPEDGEKDIFAWMVGDILNVDRLNPKLAEETKFAPSDETEKAIETGKD
jgi:pimeloyl-ACP methyl ester carboxylesterase